MKKYTERIEKEYTGRISFDVQATIRSGFSVFTPKKTTLFTAYQ
ncbi:hypothetical protein [Photorhabdus australis]|nr:hypothetical protein [Photorhabdus australis]